MRYQILNCHIKIDYNREAPRPFSVCWTGRNKNRNSTTNKRDAPTNIWFLLNIFSSGIKKNIEIDVLKSVIIFIHFSSLFIKIKNKIFLHFIRDVIIFEVNDPCQDNLWIYEWRNIGKNENCVCVWMAWGMKLLSWHSDNKNRFAYPFFLIQIIFPFPLSLYHKLRVFSWSIFHKPIIFSVR